MNQISFEDSQLGNELKDLNDELNKLEFNLEESVRSLILVNLDKFLEISNGVWFSDAMKKKLLKENNDLINLVNNLKTFEQVEIGFKSDNRRSTTALLKLPYSMKSKVTTLLIKNQEALILYFNLIPFVPKLKLIKINEDLIKELYELKVARLYNFKNTTNRNPLNNARNRNYSLSFDRLRLNDEGTIYDPIRHNLESNNYQEEMSSGDEPIDLTNSNSSERQNFSNMSTSEKMIIRKNHISAHQCKIPVISADEDLIFTGPHSESIKIWDLNFQLKATLNNHKKRITHLICDHSNKILVSVSAGSSNEIFAWDYKNSESINLIRCITKLKAKMRSIEFIKNECFENKGTLLIATQPSIDLWNYNGQIFKDKPDHQFFINKMSVSCFSASYKGEDLYLLLLIKDGIKIYKFYEFHSSQDKKVDLIYYTKKNLKINDISFLNNGIDFITIYQNGGVTVSFYENYSKDSFNNQPCLKKIKIEKDSTTAYNLLEKEKYRKFLQIDRNSGDSNQSESDTKTSSLEKKEEEYESKSRNLSSSSSSTKERNYHKWITKILEDPLQCSLQCNSFKWTKNNKFILLIYKENLFKIWKQKSNELEFELKYDFNLDSGYQIFRPHPVRNLFVLVGSNKICILNLDTGKQINSFYERGTKFTDICFSPNGSKIAAVDDKGFLSLFDLYI